MIPGEIWRAEHEDGRWFDFCLDEWEGDDRWSVTLVDSGGGYEIMRRRPEVALTVGSPPSGWRHSRLSTPRECLCGTEIPDDDSYACPECVEELLG